MDNKNKSDICNAYIERIVKKANICSCYHLNQIEAYIDGILKEYVDSEKRKG